MRFPIRSWKNTWSALSPFAPRKYPPSRNERRLARKRSHARKKAARRSRTSLFQQLEDRQLLTGTLQLLDGSTTLAKGGSDSFGSVATGASDTKTFTVNNVGSGTLTVNSLSLPNGYSTATAFPLNVPAGQSSTFTVSLYTGAAGTFNGPMTLQDSDSANTPFTVYLNGTVTSNASPVMTLRDGSTVLANGGSDSFGSVSAGTSDGKTFSVSNSGSATLTISAVSLPTGYSLQTSMPLTVAPGGSGSFAVSLNTIGPGSYSGQMSVQSNDPINNPLAINLSGTVTAPPSPTLVLSDGSTRLANGGSDSFGTVSAGASDSKTFSVQNTGNATLTISAIGLPTGFTLETATPITVAAGQSSSFVVNMNTSSAASYIGQMAIQDNDSANNPFYVNLSGTVTAVANPTIQISDGTTSLPNGGSDSFGTVALGTNATKTLTIANVGTGTLSVTAVTPPNGFSVSTPMPLAIGAGNSASLVVIMDTSATASFSGPMTLQSNDASNNPFTINLSGNVSLPPSGDLQLFDGTTALANGASDSFGSVTTGAADTKTFAIDNTGTASLSVSSITVPTGFSVQATLPLSVAAGASADFTVSMNTGTAGSFGGPMTITCDAANGNAYTVNLSGMVTTPPTPRMVVLYGMSVLANGSSDSFGTGFIGTPLTETFSIENQGDGALTLGTIQVPDGFTVSSSPAGSVPAGGSTSLSVQFNPTAGGSYSGTFSLEDNDPMQEPFTLLLSAISAIASASIDDLALVDDTGLSNTDRITSDPRVTGIADGSFGGGRLDAQIQYSTDGGTTFQDDGTVSVTTPGTSFVFDPRSAQNQLQSYEGPLVLRYRPLVYDNQNDLALTGNWATFSLTCVSINAPVARDDAFSISHGSTLSVTAAEGVTANDTNGDPGTLAVSLVTNVQHGALSMASDGSFVYTPNTGFIGQDGFTYQLSVGADVSNVASVTINSTDSPPVANDDSFEVMHDRSFTSPAGGVLANDTDADGDPLSAQLVSGPSNGVLTFNADGSFVYTPNAGYLGSDQFTYRVADSYATGNVASVLLDVNDPSSVARNDVYDVVHDRVLSVSAAGVLSNDGVPGGDPLTAQLVSGPSHGALSLNPDGSFTYTPASGFLGEDQFTYQATDGLTSGQAVATIYVTNSAPVAQNDSYRVSHDRALSIAAPGVLANDSDADGDSLALALISTVSHGTLSLNPDGSFTYVPSAGYVGDDPFSYQISDGLTSSAPATATIHVTNSAPLVVSQSFSTVHDRALVVPPSAGVLTGASDADGDPLTAQLVTGTAHGTLTLNPDGSFSYTPTGGFVGGDSFTFDASDGLATSDPATVTIQVTNRAPLAFDDSYQVIHDRVLSVSAAMGVLSVDADPDNDPLRATLVSGPNNGVLNLSADGSFSYQPHPGFVGTDQFTYYASDGVSQTLPATVSIAVTNTTPVAKDDFYEVMHDSSLVVAAATGLVANDQDGDGDTLTVHQYGSPQGQLALAADGSFTYQPPAGCTGIDHFYYYVSDGAAQSGLAEVTFTVDNPPPVAQAASWSLLHDTSLSVPATAGLLNDAFDPDGQAITPAIVMSPAHGTITLSADGSFVYVPHAGYVGSDSFSYDVVDADATSPAATVALSITDHAPTIEDASFTTLHDQALSIAAAAGTLATALDADGDSLTAVLNSGPTHGRLTLAADGSFTYVPAAGFVGADQFSVTAFDGAEQSDPATITINVTDAAPQANDDAYVVNHDHTLSVSATSGVLANDIDSDPGDKMVALLVQSPVNGSVTLNADGSFNYVPQSGFVGADVFTYAASDGLATGNTAAVTITVANDAPVSADDSYSVVHDRTLSVSAAQGVLANDIDAQNDPLTATLISGVSYGTLTFNADGSFSYAPLPGFVGYDGFSYRASDGLAQGDIVNVSLDVTDQAPIASASSYSLNEGQTFTAASTGVLTGASDADGDSLVAQLVSGPSDGTLALQSDGGFTYTPDDGFSGTDSFTFVANDGPEQSAPATVTLNVSQVNLPPTASPPAFSVHAGTSLSDNVLSAASDADGDPLSAALIAGPTNGTLTLNSDGTFTYTPNVGFVGADGFSFDVSDGVSVTAPVEATISVTNSPPTAQPASYVAYLTTPLTVSAPDGVLAHASDADGDSLMAIVASGPANGVLELNSDGSFTYTANVGFVGTDTFTYEAKDAYSTSPPATVSIAVTANTVIANSETYSVVHDRTLGVSATAGVLRNDWSVDGGAVAAQLVAPPTHGTLTLGPDGSFSYAPASGFVGSDQFSYQAAEGASKSQVVTDTILITNNPPVVAADSYTVLHDRPLIIGVKTGLLANDYDNDGDTLLASVTRTTSHGTLTLAPDGSFSYLPSPGYVGDDTFTYQASDGAASSAPALVTISVTDNAPVGHPVSYSVHHGQTLSVAAPGVRAFDYDYDADPISLVLVSTTSHGALTLNQDGSFTYAPSPLPGCRDFVGLDSFTYQLSDGALTSGPITVSISVWDDAPQANSDFFTTHFGKTIVGNVRSNDLDDDGDSFKAVLVSGRAGFTLNADGSFTYTPPPTFVGTQTVTYVDDDNALYSAPAIATIVVRDQAPVGVPDLFTTKHDQPLSGNVLTNDWDPDPEDQPVSPTSSTLRAILISPPSNASSFSLDAYGNVTYAPKAGFAGSDSFTYQVTDGALKSAVVPVTIQVTNDPPYAVDDFVRTSENHAVSGNALANDLNPDGDPLNVTLVSGPSNGTATLSASGDFSYTPNAGFLGADSFTYSISDGVGPPSVAAVQIAVMAWNVTAEDDLYNIDYADGVLNVPAAGGVLANDTTNAPSLTAQLVSEPHGGSVVFNADGSFSYAPTATFVGVDNFQYQAQMPDGDSDTATVYIHVTKQAPVAADDSFAATAGASQQVPVATFLANDQDAGGTLAPDTMVVDTKPRHGTVSIGGESLVYTPDAGFSGTDWFYYTVSDNFGLASNPAKVTVTVSAASQLMAAPDWSSGNQDTAQVINVLANDTLGGVPIVGGPGVTVTVPAAGQPWAPLYGTVSIDGNGVVTYTPRAGWHGEEAFRYTVTDAAGDTAFAVVTVRVIAVDTMAPIPDPNVHTPEGKLVSFSLTGGILRYVEVTSSVQHGQLDNATGGAFLYSPATDFQGDDSFQYIAYDADWNSYQGTVTIHVDPVNQWPVVGTDREEVSYGGSVTFNVLGLSSDPDPGDKLSISLGSGYDDYGGTWDVENNAIVYHAPTKVFPDYTEDIPFEISDLAGATTLSHVTVDYDAPPASYTNPPDPNPVELHPGQGITNQYYGVTAYNGGDSDIIVTFSVADAVGSLPPDEPVGQHYELEVSGVNGYADAGWVSEDVVPNLKIVASGSIASLNMPNTNLFLSAATAIGNETGANVVAYAGRSIGNIDASGSAVVSAGWSIASVTATGNVYSAIADLSIGPVDAGGWIGTINGGVINGPITAGGDIGTVTGTDIKQAIVSDDGNIGFGSDPFDYMTFYSSWQGSNIAAYGGASHTVIGTGVFAVGTLSGDVKAVVGKINSVRAASITSQNIKAQGDINLVAAKGSISGTNIESENGSIFGVRAGDSISNVTVKAGQNIGDTGGIPAAVGGSTQLDPLWVYGVGAWNALTNVTVSAGGNVNDVGAASASDLNLQAGGNIGLVSVGDSLSGSITAGGYIDTITTNSLQMSCQGPGLNDYFDSLKQDVSCTINATGVIKHLLVGRDLTGSVNAAALPDVEVARDMQATINATGAITSLMVGRTIKTSVTGGSVNVVNAGYDITTGADVTSTAGVTAVIAGHTLAANVTAKGGDIGLVAAGWQPGIGPIYGGIYSEYGWRDQATSNGTISGSTIKASGGIDQVIAYGGIGLGGVIQGATITAQAGDINSVTATSSISATISASGGIDLVTSGLTQGGDMTGADFPGTSNGGDLSGSIDAQGGSLGAVSAASSPFTAGIGSILATVHALTDIGNVTAGLDIGGTITAGHSLPGGVTAGRDILKKLTATNGDIKFVSAGRDIAGGVSAGGSIGDVTAGRNIGADATSVTAGKSLGNVTAGTAGAGGNIVSSLEAGGSIGNVAALGGAGTSDVSTSDLPSGLNGAGDQWWVETAIDPAGPLDAPLPPWVVLKPDGMPAPDPNAGNISGAISAGQALGTVTAYGDIGQAISAGLTVGAVWALGDIGGAISANVGGLTVNTWGSLKKDADLNAPGDIAVSTYDDLAGSVDSTTGAISATSWGNITGSLTAVGNVTAWALDNISGAITSNYGETDVTLYGTLSSAVNAFLAYFVYADNIDGASIVSQVVQNLWQGAVLLADDVVAVFGDISNTTIDAGAGASSKSSSDGYWNGGELVIATGDINACTILASVGADVVAGGSITGNTRIDTSSAAAKGGASFGWLYGKDDFWITPGWVNIIAKENCDATAVAYTDLRVNAKKVTGSYTANGNAVINAYADSSVTKVEAGDSVAMFVNGSLSGPITSDNGPVRLDAAGNVTSDITAEAVGLSTWGSYSGTIDATDGAIGLQAYGGVSGTLTATNEVNLESYGDVTANVTAGGYASLFASGNVTNNVTAKGDISIMAFGNVQSTVVAGSGGAGNYQASVASNGSVGGSITAPNNVSVRANGKITATVTATNGNATVVGAGGINIPTITAGNNIDVEGVGSLSLPSATATNGSLTVWGSTQVDVTGTAKTAANVASEDTLKTTLNLSAPQAAVNVAGWSKQGGTSATAVDATVNADAAAVSVTSGGGAKVAINGAGGSGNVRTADVDALGDLSGTVNATDDAELTGWTSVSSLTANTSGAGSQLNVFSGGDANATLMAGNALSATALGNVLGTYKSGLTQGFSDGGATIGGMAGVNATIDAGGSANVNSNADAQGAVTANADATVTATHSVLATVTTGGDATVSALTGDVGATVTAAQDADVSAGGNLNADVVAGANAAVLLLGAMIHSVTANGGDASVTALGAVSGTTFASHDANVYGQTIGATVTANNDATAFSATDVTAGVTAQHDADVTALGSIASTAPVKGGNNASAFAGGSVQAPVEATAGDANVTSGGALSATVTAGQDAAVWTLGAVSQNVQAGRDLTLTGWNDVTGTLNAGRTLQAAVYGNLPGDVTSGGETDLLVIGSHAGHTQAGADANVTTGGDQSGDVSAGGAADVESRGSISGKVTATGDASAFAIGSITGDVGAGGSASVAAWQTLHDTITAAQDATAFSGADMQVSITATHGSASADAGTSGNVTMSAGQDGEASAFTSLTANMTTGGDADLFSYGTAGVNVIAGGDATLTTGDWLGGTVQATGSIDALAMGNISGTYTAGVNGSLVSAQNILTVNLTAPYAMVVGWSSAAGFDVEGAQDAFAFSYGTMQGTLRSSAGTAEAFAAGNADVSVNAATTATVNGLGDVQAQLTSGGDSQVFAAGLLTGGVNAGRDAYAASYGYFQIGVTAGRDVYASSVGDMAASLAAGRNLWAISYGNLDAEPFTAGQNIVLVGARGDITGAVSATGDVQRVAAYGAINAAISAGNAQSGAPGTVWLVEAYINVSGSITATQAVETVRSAHDITASVSAPVIGSIDPNDHLVMSGYPATPNTNLGSVWAELADEYHGVLDAQAALAADAIGQSLALGAAQALDAFQFQPSMGTLASAAAAMANATYQLQGQAALIQDGAAQQFLLAQAGQHAFWSLLAAQAAADQAALVAQTHQAIVSMDQSVADFQEQSAEMQQAALLTQDAMALARQTELGIWNNYVAVKRLVEIDAEVKNLRAQWWHGTLFIAGGVVTVLSLGSGSPVLIAADVLIGGFNAGIYFWEGRNRDGLTELAFTLGPLVFAKVLRGGKLADDVGEINAVRRAASGGADAAQAAARAGRGVIGDAVASAGRQAVMHCPIIGECFVAGTLAGGAAPWSEAHGIAPGNTDALLDREAAQSSLFDGWLGTVLFVAMGLGSWQACNRRERRKQSEEEAVDELFGCADLDTDGPVIDEATLALVSGSRVPAIALAERMTSYAAVADICSVNPIPYHSALPIIPRIMNRTIGMPSFIDQQIGGPNLPSQRVHTRLEAHWNLRRRRQSRLGLALLAFFTLLGCIWPFVPRGGRDQAAVPLVAAATARAGSRGDTSHPRVPKLRMKPIEQYRTGERIIVTNPLGGEDEPEPNQRTWRSVDLRLRKPSGKYVTMSLLLSPERVEDLGVLHRHQVALDLPEMGVSGQADVLSVGPCPVIELGPGSVITGTFQHESDGNLLSVFLEGLDEPLGVTENHPFFSEDRDDFVPAGELHPGELIADFSEGGGSRVARVVPRQGDEPVYNLQVNGQHVYYVGANGAIVHNSCLLTPYSADLGHHIFSKRAFEGLANYNAGRALAIGRAELNRLGLVHLGPNSLTSTQRRLFAELARSGRPNTLAEHARIAREVLIEHGVDPKDAKNAVRRALNQLNGWGITSPAHLPWGDF